MAERSNSKDAMEKLLARGLRQGLDTTGRDCPDAGILAAYFDHALNSDETRRWELHFSTCGRCQEQLAALARSEPATAIPASAPFRLWRWQWLAPLAAGAAAVALWIAVRPPEPTPVATVHQAQAPPAAGNKDGRLEESEKLSKTLADRPAAPAPPKPTDTFAAKSKLPAVTGGLAAGKEAAAAPARAEVDRAAKFGERRDVPTTPAAAGTGAATAERQLAELKTQQVPSAAQQNAAEPSRVQSQVQVAREESQKTDQVTPRAAPRAEAPSSTDEGRYRAKKETAQETYEQDKKKAAADTRAFSAIGQVGGTLSKRSAPLQFAAAGSKMMWRYSDGDLQRSTDAGLSWISSMTPTHTVTAGVCVSEKACWAVGESGLVLRTTDGTTWETASAPTTANLIAVKARDGSRVTVVAADGKGFETTDAGKTWKPVK